MSTQQDHPSTIRQSIASMRADLIEAIDAELASLAARAQAPMAASGTSPAPDTTDTDERLDALARRLEGRLRR